MRLQVGDEVERAAVDDDAGRAVVEQRQRPRELLLEVVERRRVLELVAVVFEQVIRLGHQHVPRAPASASASVVLPTRWQPDTAMRTDHLVHADFRRRATMRNRSISSSVL